MNFCNLWYDSVDGPPCPVRRVSGPTHRRTQILSTFHTPLHANTCVGEGEGQVARLGAREHEGVQHAVLLKQIALPRHRGLVHLHALGRHHQPVRANLRGGGAFIPKHARYASKQLARERDGRSGLGLMWEVLDWTGAAGDTGRASCIGRASVLACSGLGPLDVELEHHCACMS